MKKTIIYSVLVLMTTLALTACSSSGGGIQYVPFQETENGKWGMISPDGKVLFQEEFKEEPTVVRDNRFFVQNKDGIWEMYDATEKPRKIGKDYIYATSFSGGVALVTEKNKPVTIIDTDGNIKATLNKIEVLYPFEDDWAVFSTKDAKGAIDKSGKWVIKPEYCFLEYRGDGKFYGINKKYKKYQDGTENNKGKIKNTIVDSNGKVLFEFTNEKYESFNTFSDGYMPVSVMKGGEEIWGIINDKGEFVVKPSAKYKYIKAVRGETFIYNNGKGSGLMNFKGETLIRAKYESLDFDSDGMLLAQVKDGNKMVYRFIDDKDNKLSDDTYTKAQLYSMFDGEHTFVKPDDNMWSIIDKNGKTLEKLPDMVNISLKYDPMIASDYVDMQALLAYYKITYNGVLGITVNSSPQQVAEMAAKQGFVKGDDQYPATSARWHAYIANRNFVHYTEEVSVSLYVNFPDYMSTSYFNDYDWTTDYVWNDVKPETFKLLIYNDGRMKGKLRLLFTALTDKFKKMGNVVKQNNGAMVVQMKNGMRAFICMEKNKVTAEWGKLQPASWIDIAPYKDVKEEY